MRGNWECAFYVVKLESISGSSNVICCHNVNKVKYDGIDGLRLKTRNVLHGNRDRDRFGVLRNSASADTSVVRLVLSLGFNLGLDFGTADVKGAYMKSGPTKRGIYVRPPKENLQDEKARSRS